MGKKLGYKPAQARKDDMGRHGRSGTQKPRPIVIPSPKKVAKKFNKLVRGMMEHG